MYKPVGGVVEAAAVRGAGEITGTELNGLRGVTTVTSRAWSVVTVRRIEEITAGAHTRGRVANASIRALLALLGAFDQLHHDQLRVGEGVGITQLAFVGDHQGQRTEVLQELHRPGGTGWCAGLRAAADHNNLRVALADGRQRFEGSLNVGRLRVERDANSRLAFVSEGKCATVGLAGDALYFVKLQRVRGRDLFRSCERIVSVGTVPEAAVNAVVLRITLAAVDLLRVPLVFVIVHGTTTGVFRKRIIVH